MKKNKNKVEMGFKDLTPKERVLTVAIMGLSAVIFVLAILQLVCIWEASIKIYVPLMAVMMVLQAVLSWEKNRKTSYMYLGVAAFLVICSVFILCFG